MYEEITKLIQVGEFGKALQMIDKLAEDDPKKYNLLGLVHFNQGALDKAKESFEKGLKYSPVDSDLLFNYGYVLKELGNDKEAWRYLLRISNKDWATYDLLGDTQLKSGNLPMALRYYKKAAELSDNEEMKKKFESIQRQVKKDTKIAFLCLPGLDNFLKDIVETLSLLYDVKLVVSTDGKAIVEAIKWADIVWLEWANELAVEVTRKVPELARKKVICRLHSYEVFTNFPRQIDWTKIDRLVFVANHIKEIFHELHPDIQLNSEKETVVHNGVDLDKFKFTVHGPGYNLAAVAHINYKKDPAMWLQIIAKLVKLDRNYKLHIAGDFQDPRYKVYFEHAIKEMGLQNNMILHGWVSNIDQFLEEKNYVISTSIHEGHPYNVMEAMARGIKTLILNYRGAREQWPSELLYNTLDEAIGMVTNGGYDSENYRKFIETNYALEKQLNAIYEILTGFGVTGSRTVSIGNEKTISTKNFETFENSNQIKTYYDKFLDKLKADHIRENPRHKHVKNTLMKLVKPGMKVLDIGCGTGISSYFMASQGAIVTAVDLSEKLIEFAKQNSYHENITYLVADATKLDLGRNDYDLITMIDVMEHIPSNVIHELFEVIKRHTNSSTVIYLNIPDARYQTFARNNFPERLQIVDEAYSLDFLIQQFGKIGFEPIMINVYGIDMPYQYDEIILISRERLQSSYREWFSKYIH